MLRVGFFPRHEIVHEIVLIIFFLNDGRISCLSIYLFISIDPSIYLSINLSLSIYPYFKIVNYHSIYNGVVFLSTFIYIYYIDIYIIDLSILHIFLSIYLSVLSIYKFISRYTYKREPS